MSWPFKNQSSAKQTIHTIYQNLFSIKTEEKKYKVSFAATVIDPLRIIIEQLIFPVLLSYLLLNF